MKKQQFRYVHCICGMLVRVENVPEHISRPAGAGDAILFAGVCPYPACKVQITVAYAPAAVIQPANATPPRG